MTCRAGVPGVPWLEERVTLQQWRSARAEMLSVGFKTNRNNLILTFSKYNCLARRVPGSNGLCTLLLYPQEGAAVVSGDDGEKAMAAKLPF